MSLNLAEISIMRALVVAARRLATATGNLDSRWIAGLPEVRASCIQVQRACVIAEKLVGEAVLHGYAQEELGERRPGPLLSEDMEAFRDSLQSLASRIGQLEAREGDAPTWLVDRIEKVWGLVGRLEKDDAHIGQRIDAVEEQVKELRASMVKEIQQAILNLGLHGIQCQ